VNGLIFTLVLVAIAGLLWNAMSAFESWRILRARRQPKKFGGLRLFIGNRRRAS